MATYTLEINERTKVGKSIVNLIKSLGSNIASIKPLRTSGIEQGLADLEAGRVERIDDVKDLFKSL